MELTYNPAVPKEWEVGDRGMMLRFASEGAGRIVLLLHGFPLDHTMWEGQRAAIGQNYHVIMPDLRGHGQTEAPDGIYPIDDMADDVIELLDSLKITEPVVVGGLSMGGYLALSLAVRYPKRLCGLMLIDTRAASDTKEAARAREQLASSLERGGEVEGATSVMIGRLFADSTRVRHPEIVSRTSEVMRKTSPRAIIGCLRGMAVRPDRTNDLGRITIPTLVMAGEADLVIPLAESQSMAAAMPNAELVIIPDAGHLAPLENPPVANAAILRFLGSLA